MSIFEGKSIGIGLSDNHVNVDISKFQKIDFVIVDAGTGSIASELSSNHINDAYKLNAICIIKFNCDPELYWGYTDILPEVDKDQQIKVLDNVIYYNGSVSPYNKRMVHGIMIDCSKYLQVDNKIITDYWVQKIGQDLIDKVWNRYKLPVYLYITPDTVNTLVGQFGSATISAWLKNWNICTWTTATPENTATVNGDPAKLEIPGDEDKPNITYAKGWDMWKYANTKYVFANVTNKNNISQAVPLWISNKTRIAFDTEVNYIYHSSGSSTSGSSTSGSNSGNSDSTVSNNNLIEILADLQSLIQKEDEDKIRDEKLQNELDEIRKHFS
jgi:hypothetical protein